MIVLLLKCYKYYIQALKSLTADNAILCPSFQLEQPTELNDYITL